MKMLLISLFTCFMAAQLTGQIIINEVNIADEWVELYNSGTTTVDINNYTLCNFPRYGVISSAAVTLLSGSAIMAPGDITVVRWANNISPNGATSGEMGIYQMPGMYNSTTNIQDYVQWGAPNHGRSSTAVSAGVWDNASTFLPAPTNPSNSLSLVVGNHMGATDTDSMDWEERSPTQGAVNNLLNHVIINEVNISDEWVELYNAGTTAIDISSYTLCNFPRYGVVSSNAVTLLSGSLLMAPGDITVVRWANNISPNGATSGEMGIYQMPGMYASTTNIQDYVQWGAPNHGRSSTAVSAGVWDNASTFLPAPTNPANSLSLVMGPFMGGTDTDSMDWEEQVPTLGMDNGSTMADCPIDLDISGTIPQDTFYASNNILSNGTIAMGDTVIFVAGNEIMLNEGFTVELSAVFEASIGACP